MVIVKQPFPLFKVPADNFIQLVCSVFMFQLAFNSSLINPFDINHSIFKKGFARGRNNSMIILIIVQKMGNKEKLLRLSE